MMLEGEELKMYEAVGKKVKIIMKDGSKLVGKCTEFSSAYDNDPDEASVTLDRPLKDGKKLPWLVEVMSNEIEELEYCDIATT